MLRQKQFLTLGAYISQHYRTELSVICKPIFLISFSILTPPSIEIAIAIAMVGKNEAKRLTYLMLRQRQFLTPGAYQFQH